MTPSLIERPQWYVQQFPNPSLVAGSSLLGVGLRTDSDAPFRLCGIAVYTLSSAGVPLAGAGNVAQQIRFTRPDGTWFQRDILSAQQINPFDQGAVNGAGGAASPFFQYFSPLHPNILYPANSVIQIDQQALAANEDALVIVVFVGTKMFQPGAIWWPTYPASFSARPFSLPGFSVQIPLAQIPVRDFKVPQSSQNYANPNSDADFVWQMGSQSDYRPNFKGLGIKIKDWTGKYFMNDYVPLELIFGFDNSQTPGIVYPEIYIPRNQALFIDVQSLA